MPRPVGCSPRSNNATSPTSTSAYAPPCGSPTQRRCPRVSPVRRCVCAASLRDHAPEVAAAWCQGRIGEHHAQLFAKAVDNTRIRDAFTPMIASLLDDAATLLFDVWRAQVIALISLLDADGDEPRDPSDDNRLGFTRGLSGRWILRGEFDAVTGGVIRDALNDRAERLFHARSNDEAVAGTDLIVPSQQRLLADALHDMARNDRAANAAAGKGGRAEILLHFDAVDPTKLLDDDGVAIGDTGYWAATCDPTLRGVVFGMHRTVLAVANEQRLVSRGAASSDGPPRWRLRVPPLHREGVMDRRPPRHPLAQRRPDRPREPRVAVPVPPRRVTPKRVAHGRHRRRMVLVADPHRPRVLVTTPPRPTNRTTTGPTTPNSAEHLTATPRTSVR